jgi:hypothetical protein
MDQFKNAMCDMQSLERTFTLVSLAPLILFHSLGIWNTTIGLHHKKKVKNI